MSYNFGTRKPILDSSLVLYLDAANPKSFVNGSSTWSDVSSAKNDGIFVSGSNYNSSNGGGLVFDGTNKWVNMGTNSSHVFTGSYSISIWLKNTTTATNEFIILSGVGTLNGGFLNYSLRKLASVYTWYLSDGTNIYIYATNTNINTQPTNVVLTMESGGNTT